MEHKKIAIMQPYLFPYIGYFQLIQAVDIFVFYDDVNFIKQGWINRNKILLTGKEYLFTLPVNNASSFQLINETKINYKIYAHWRRKLLKSIAQEYKKSPFFDQVYLIVESILSKEYHSISEMGAESIRTISDYIGLKTKFVTSSKEFANTKGLEKANRIIEIVKRLHGSNYVNPSGGRELYEKSYFENSGVTLQFIINEFSIYKQFGNDFVQGLSIIDVLMFNNKEQVRLMIDKFVLK